MKRPTTRLTALLALSLVVGASQARTELWLPTGEAGKWGPTIALPSPNENVLGKLRCQKLSSSPTPVWTLFLQPAGIEDTQGKFHNRDESGFGNADIMSRDGKWISTASLPRLKWGPWLANLKGTPPNLPDCNVAEVRLRLYQDQDKPVRRRAKLEAVRCRPGDPLRQASCAH